MADNVSKAKRSQTMAAVKSKDSKIELAFRKELWRNGFRYRKNSPKYFGKPDLVFKKYKLVIFIDSCFWHGCKKHLRLPSTNKKYWETKIRKNIERDKEVNKHYKSISWKIIRIWEHQLKTNPEKEYERIFVNLTS
jgi:DNA mismatch endonuclease (patch repair protein)